MDEVLQQPQLASPAADGLVLEVKLMRRSTANITAIRGTSVLPAKKPATTPRKASTGFGLEPRG